MSRHRHRHWRFFAVRTHTYQVNPDSLSALVDSVANCPRRSPRVFCLAHPSTLLALFVLLLLRPATAQAYTITDLGVLPDGGGSFASAMNNNGQIVGYSKNMFSQRLSPFLWENGAMKALGFNDAEAVDVNSRGEVLIRLLAGQSSNPARIWKDGIATLVDRRRFGCSLADRSSGLLCEAHNGAAADSQPANTQLKIRITQWPMTQWPMIALSRKLA